MDRAAPSRQQYRHLVELGGLIVKAGSVDLTGEDRAIIFVAQEPQDQV